METSLSCENNRSLFVPAGLSAIGILDGSWLAMRTESIDRTGLFVIAKEYVKPREIFDLIIWPGEQERPIHVTVTASCVERTWDGYGIWAQISAASTQNKLRWELCYTSEALSGVAGYSETLRAAQLLEPHRVAVLGHALPGATIERLRAAGSHVERIQNEAQVHAWKAHGPIDLVIAEMNDPLLTLVSRGAARTPQTLIIIQPGSESEFEQALYSGAVKVIARPCSPSMLSTRILELLYSRRNARPAVTPPRETRHPFAQRAHGALLKKLSDQMAAFWSSAREVLARRAA